SWRLDLGPLPKLSYSTNSTAKSRSTQHLPQKKDYTNCQELCNPDLSTYDPALPSVNTLPRHFAQAGVICKDKQNNSQIIQKLDLEKKEDVFLEHLIRKCPHQAAVITEHRESIKTDFQLSNSSGNGLVEQKFACELLSLQICASVASSRETRWKWQQKFIFHGFDNQSCDVC
ncbi:hypothetical protein ILYODFUR_011678, partial [Ilyodon furcidens]